MGWTEFIAAFATFLLAHMIPSRRSLRARLVARLGESGFMLAYSLLSALLLAWVIVAAGRAPYVPLWDWAPWQLRVPQTGVLIACLLVAFALGRPNPFSLGGARNADFDPSRPGVLRLTRHPLMLALAIWAAAHIVPNGDLAHVIMFGSFTAFALAGIVLLDRRNKRRLGRQWDALRSALSTTPRRPPLPGRRRADLMRVLAGLAVWAVLLLLHRPVLGVSPY